MDGLGSALSGSFFLCKASPMNSWNFSRGSSDFLPLSLVRSSSACRDAAMVRIGNANTDEETVGWWLCPICVYIQPQLPIATR